jgi:hypothetical protein
MQSQEQLQLAISKILEEKTFSVDAMEAIKNLKIEYENALLKIEGLEKNLDTLQRAAIENGKTYTDLKIQYQELYDRSFDVGVREECVKIREIEQTLVDMKALHQADRVADFKEVLSMVFKSPIYKKTTSSSVNESIPVVTTSNGYSSVGVHNVNKSATETIREEEE